MSESKNPQGIRTPGPEPEPKPIPAGSGSRSAIARNQREAAGVLDPEGPKPEETAQAVDLLHKATGRDPDRPGVL
jgi:alkanesulfonate monooxygenase SsuD/methylene tetrahydromethanopterin reductase-like flavin-dependent oxidoreductase (luciferase family)